MKTPQIASICILFSLVTASFAAEPNLVAWWQFDEGTGTIAYDSAGSNDGNLVNGPVWTTGKIGGGLSFDGTDDYVNCGSGASNYDNITVSAWMKTSTFGALVSNHYYYNSYGTWYTLFSNVIEIGDNSQGGYKYLTFNTPTLDGLWHHVVYTKNGINHAIYVDGSLDQQFTSNADISQNVPLFIGRKWITSNSNPWLFNGIIDDVRIYDRALSAEEIYALSKIINKALLPYPSDEASCVTPNVALTWRPGDNVVFHDVYLGTDFNEVNEANTSDISGIYKGRQDANFYTPLGLQERSTYYWRIDEVNDADINSPWIGNVCSFTTSGAPDISLSAPQFQFGAVLGNPNPPTQILTIRNTCTEMLNWKIDYDCGWLNVEPNSGSSAGGPNNVNLSVNVSGLAAGDYQCNLTVSDPCASNSPQTVVVDLNIIPECFPSSDPNYGQWVSVGKPSSWCGSNRRQCHGDADNTLNFVGKGAYWVAPNDLAILVAGWEKPYTNPTACPWIAADFDHKAQTVGKSSYRVSPNDLMILVRNWERESLNEPPADCPHLP